MARSIWQYISLAAIVIVCIGTGFFFGAKSKVSETKTFAATTQDLAKIAETKQEEIKIIEKEIPEVYFIKTGDERQCPKDYPIKGKFDTVPIFYTTQNKTYNRVNPHLCFATEVRAIENGFVEKK